ncbi:MAG: hypothetical protein JO147_10515 [Actinobacteria bacterium]|nr:hypothetical protein [Actinomycetota bacterium]
MNSDPAAQLRLLDLQSTDTALAQLAHRRATLPELGQIAALRNESDALRSRRVDGQTALDDLATDQRRMENDVETVRNRAARDNDRLQGGGLPAKELESLQHELMSLARRQSDLEDELLEVMERRETSEAEVAEFDRQLAAIAAQLADAEQHRDDQFGDIDDSVTARRAQRSAIAAELPADLLALYERVATANGGVGAAALRQRRCEGCHLELAGSELTSVRAAAPEAVVRCDNCGRILVRTAESGL